MTGIGTNAKCRNVGFRAAVGGNSGRDGGSYFSGAFDGSARSFGLTPLSCPVHSDAEIRDLISDLGRGDQSGGLVVMADALRDGRLKTFAAQKDCPSRFAKRDIVVLSVGWV